MTKYDKQLQTGTKEYEAARKPDRDKKGVARELAKARRPKEAKNANHGRRS